MKIRKEQKILNKFYEEQSRDRWIPNSDYSIYHCSVCGFSVLKKDFFSNQEKYNICPMCFSDMYNPIIRIDENNVVWLDNKVIGKIEN